MATNATPPQPSRAVRVKGIKVSAKTGRYLVPSKTEQRRSTVAQFSKGDTKR